MNKDLVSSSAYSALIKFRAPRSILAVLTGATTMTASTESTYRGPRENDSTAVVTPRRLLRVSASCCATAAAEASSLWAIRVAMTHLSDHDRRQDRDWQSIP